jgi:transposase
VIDFESFHEIRRLSVEFKLTPQQIAERTGHNIKTVRKHLRKGRYEPRQKPARRASKLDPYKDMIIAWLEKYPFSGEQIRRRLCAEHGYTGGKSILNEFILSVRPVRYEAFLKLAFESGDCMQVDWGTHGVILIGDTPRKLHYFSAVLCYSRQLYVEFFLSQSMECFLSGHRNALEYFGCSPRRVMHDNLKTAVIERRPGCAPVFNPRYLDFAAHYGFKPVACNVRRGNEKGRVENSIGYIQKNFLAGLEISGFEALNAEGRAWMEQVANVRTHRETGKRPCDLFEEEKHVLQPLPIARYDIAVSRRVRASNRCRVTFEGNRYTIPFEHAGQLLELRAEPYTVLIYRGEKLIAQHPRSYARNLDFENPDHVSRLLSERKRAEDAALLARFLALSPKAERYYTALRERELHAFGHVRRILMLAGEHGNDAVRLALEEATELEAYSADYLHNILQHRRALAPIIGALHLTHGAELLKLEVQPPDCTRYQIRAEESAEPIALSPTPAT